MEQHTCSPDNGNSEIPSLQTCDVNQSFNLLPIIYVPENFMKNYRLPTRPDQMQDSTKPLNNHEKLIYDELMHKMYGYTVKKPSYTNISQTPSRENNYSTAEPNVKKCKTRILLEASSFPRFEYFEENATIESDYRKPKNLSTGTAAVSTSDLNALIKRSKTQNSNVAVASQTSPTCLQKNVLLSTKYSLLDEINESKFTQTDCVKFSSCRSTQTGVQFNKDSVKKNARETFPNLTGKSNCKAEDRNSPRACVGKKENNRTIQQEILSVIQPKVYTKKKKKPDDSPLLTALCNNLVQAAKTATLKTKLRNKGPNKQEVSKQP